MSEVSIKKHSYFKSCLIVFLVFCVFALWFFLIFIPKARDEARAMVCTNNCKQLELIFYNYHSVYGCYPPAYTVDENGKPLHSWRVLVLPFMYQQHLYSEIRLDEPWDSEYNRQFHDRMPSQFACPSCRSLEPETSKTNYLRIVGPGTLTNGPDTVSREQIDQPESTILLVESTRSVCWMTPEDLTLDDLKLGVICQPEKGQNVGISSLHRKQAHVVLCDDSVHHSVLQISPDTPSQLLEAAARVRLKPKSK